MQKDAGYAVLNTPASSLSSVTSPAARIASLLASGTEMLYGLGLGERVVAVSHECDYPPEAAQKPRVTRTRVDASADSRTIDDQVQAAVASGAALYDIDVALLAELRPELIVTQAQCDVCAVRYADVLHAVETEPGLAGARVVALNPQSFADIFDDIRRVGEAAGCSGVAERYVAELLARLDAVRSRTVNLAPHERPRVVGVEWSDPLMAAGNWFPEMVELAGGTNRLTQAGVHSPYVDWASIVDEDPQVMIVMPCGFDLPRAVREAKSLEAIPGWHELSAVRRGRVFAVDGNAYFNRSGPRMVDSLEILAHLLHPDRFPAPPANCFARVE